MPKRDYHIDRLDCTCGACVMRRYEGGEEAERERVESVRRLMGDQFDAITNRLPS